MMKEHRVTRLRTVGGAAAFGLLLAGGIGLTGTTSFAQEAKTGQFKIVKKIGADGKSSTISDDEFAEITKDCPEARRLESAIASSGPGQRPRIILCNKGGTADSGKMIASLERARDRIGGDESPLPADRRAEARAQIQAEIDRLRAR